MAASSSNREVEVGIGHAAGPGPRTHVPDRTDRTGPEWAYGAGPDRPDRTRPGHFTQGLAVNDSLEQIVSDMVRGFRSAGQDIQGSEKKGGDGSIREWMRWGSG